MFDGRRVHYGDSAVRQFNVLNTGAQLLLINHSISFIFRKNLYVLVSVKIRCNAVTGFYIHQE